jgi:hypothetical protein
VFLSLTFFMVRFLTHLHSPFKKPFINR